jgi:xanthine dehydrogenase accessory factor
MKDAPVAQHVDLTAMMRDMEARELPYALATVVRTVSVTAAKAGAKAIILADGSIQSGWIGGGCARAAVLKAAKDALADGNPRLVSIQPKDLLADLGVVPGDEKAGVNYAANNCPSQGTMDIFVEPVLPLPELVILGASPVALALAEIAQRYGFAINHAALPDALSGISARSMVVIATQGSGDLVALRAALAAEPNYVSFVGSRRKMASLSAKLANEVDAARLAAVKAPAGLDIGAITPDEIALSILTELIALRRKRQRNSDQT